MTMKFTTEASIQIPREELKRTMAICRRPTMSLLRCHKEKETFVIKEFLLQRKRANCQLPTKDPSSYHKTTLFCLIADKQCHSRHSLFAFLPSFQEDTYLAFLDVDLVSVVVLMDRASNCISELSFPYQDVP